MLTIAPPSHHERRGRPRHRDDAADVDAQQLGGGVGVDLLERDDRLHARVVDDDVRVPPKASTALPQIAAASRSTSPVTTAARSPSSAARASAASARAFACTRTDAPASWSRRAIPPPIVPLAPVTTATRPERSSSRATGGAGSSGMRNIISRLPFRRARRRHRPDRALRHGAASRSRARSTRAPT